MQLAGAGILVIRETRVGIAGAGGFLQAAFHGYTGLRINDTAMTLTPVLPTGWHSIKLRGIAYKGSRLDIAYASTLSVTVLSSPADQRKATPTALTLVDAAGTRHALKAGVPLTLAALQSVSISETS